MSSYFPLDFIPLDSIGVGAFFQCEKLTSVTIPNGVISIEGRAFSTCSSLTSVTIPKSVTVIGDVAFEDSCLTDVYYGGDRTDWESISIGSGNNELLHNATIHYNSTGPGMGGTGENPGPDQPDVPDVPVPPTQEEVSLHVVDLPFYTSLNGHQNTILVNWGLELFQRDSYTTTQYESYDSRIAVAASALSAASERSEETAEMTLRRFGFNDDVDSVYYGEDTVTMYDYPAASFGHKKVTIDGKEQHFFAVVVRGTTDLGDVYTDLYSVVSGFYPSHDNIYSALNNFIRNKCHLDPTLLVGNSKFFITGHSLGGAVANLLSATLSATYGVKNIFAYTFASPTTLDNDIVFGNIYNIMNSEDVVPLVPPGSSGRYGLPIWFSRNNGTGIQDNFRILTGGMNLREIMEPSAHFLAFWESAKDLKDQILGAHVMETYMSYLLAASNENDVKLVGGTISRELGRHGACRNGGGIWCPVDLKIYAQLAEGRILVGSVTDGKLDPVDAPIVALRVDGDKKYFYFPLDGEYSVELSGTGDGTMAYFVQDIDLTTDSPVGGTGSVYQQVQLNPGKPFLSEIKIQNGIATGITTENVPLYVLDDGGQPELKVLPDGKGTEVPLDATIYTIAFNANGGTVNPGYAVTDSSGRLTNLPIPTLTNYKFNGWFTATSGGTKITTETVFDSDTTIYAQWTKDSTNPGESTTPPTSPSNPIYNPGGSYTPPTYSITMPNVSGGKLNVNPTSASSGSTVIITATPDAGYKLTSLTVSDANGKNLELSSKAENQYTFKMPSGKVTVAAQFQPINVTTLWQNPFTDISEGDWHFDAVRFVNENGLMNGVGNNSFAPNANLSRAMFAQILYNKAGRPNIVNNYAFSDIPDGAWFTDAVAWGAANSIINGYNGQFKPDDPITREQLVLMLWRYEGQPTASSTLLNFADATEVSDYALDAMRWAVEKGIIKGKGNGILDPQGLATRAETAQILKNYLEN
ncbi:S-layer homology domain-containing protein [uncultured Bacteroides sp.]|uniref:S-layer homology domain-containing protein n=1 Tax=uncultured Bacteroides sp. TaxID=162156 RepID=UPI00351F6A74